MKRFLLGLIYTMTTVFSPGAFAVERIVTADLIEGIRAPKNYMGNKGHFEKNANGFASYADAAAASPVDGTGGAATNTCTQTTTTPLAGVGSFLITHGGTNRQGDGCSASFSIDVKDKAKVLQISFDYIVASGTYAAGDQTVWVYDVTNSRLIQPTGSSLLNVGVAQKQVLEFQTSSDSVSYRLIFHTASTSTSSYTVKIDDINISPLIAVLGSSTTDWISFTPTGSWVSNTTYTGQWRRVGDTAKIRYKLALTGAPTAATLTLNLPTGMTIDSAKVVNQSFLGHVLDSGTDEYPVTFKIASGVFSGTTFVTSGGAGTFPSIGNNLNATSPITFANGDYIDVTVEAPIVGWGTAQALSSDTDTRVVAMINRTDPTATITGSDSLATFLTPGTDTHGAFSAGVYTVKVPGLYKVSASLAVTATYAANNNATITIRKNGTAVNSQLLAAGAVTVTTLVPTIAATVSCVAGDTLAIGISSNGTTPVVASGIFNFFNLERISGPSQVAASEAVSFNVDTSTTAATTSAPFLYTNVIFDSHSAYAAGTGKFTAPRAGKCIFHWTNYTGATAAQAKLHKNGTAACNGSSSVASTSTGAGGCTISMIAGDTAEIRPETNATASGATILNQFSGLCVGL